MFRITYDPSSGSDNLYLIEITYNVSNVVCVYVAHTHHRSRICRQTPNTCTIRTFEPLYVISVNYRLSLLDDGSYVIRNMLE